MIAMSMSEQAKLSENRRPSDCSSERKPNRSMQKSMDARRKKQGHLQCFLTAIDGFSKSDTNYM